MAKIEIGTGRSRIKELSQGIEIIIPAKKNYFLLLFLAFWLVGWVVGEVSVIRELLHTESKAPTLFMIAWLGGWTVGGGFAMLVWLWNLKGQEVVTIDGRELKHIRDFVLFSRSKEYEVAHIKDLRTNPHLPSMFSFGSGLEFWGIGGGTVAFDYGYSTHKFGSGLDEGEAKHIIEIITNKYPNFQLAPKKAGTSLNP